MRDFCLFAILTINFVNCIHTDIRDKMYVTIADRAIESLEEIAPCKYLSAAPREQVKSSLHHIRTFGISTATTCGFRIVRDNNQGIEVEVKQFFCCYGLGTCYRVKNYCVHNFLSALFSHYTSAQLYICDGKVYTQSMLHNYLNPFWWAIFYHGEC